MIPYIEGMMEDDSRWHSGHEMLYIAAIEYDWIEKLREGKREFKS